MSVIMYASGKLRRRRFFPLQNVHEHSISAEPALAPARVLRFATTLTQRGPLRAPASAKASDHSTFARTSLLLTTTRNRHTCARTSLDNCFSNKKSTQKTHYPGRGGRRGSVSCITVVLLNSLPQIPRHFRCQIAFVVNISEAITPLS